MKGTVSCDKGIKIGDLVTTYKKGYFIVTGITRRFLTQEAIDKNPYWNGSGKVGGDEYASTIYSRQIMSQAFKPKKGDYSCDEGYCEVVTEKELMNKINAEAKANRAGCKALFELYEESK
jgi:DNA-directed RNA polymerase beta subunit